LNFKTLYAIIIIFALVFSNFGIAQAAAITNTVALITGTVKGQAINPRNYYTISPTASASAPLGAGNPLGSYDRSSAGIDELFINAEVYTHADPGETIQRPVLYYRVYRSDNLEDLGGLIPLPMDNISGSINGDAKWSTTSNRTNLIQFATSPGTYTLQVYSEAGVLISGAPNATVSDNNNGLLYVTTFTVTVNGSNVQAARWNPSRGNNNWFVASNWDTGNIPNSNTNITIPYMSGASYPIITNDDPIAYVNNLTLAGRGPTQKASLTLNGSQLYISGNFQDVYGGLSQAADNILYLSGLNQVFDIPRSGTFTLFNLGVTGGGTKTITATLGINRNVTFTRNFDGSPAGTLVTGIFAINLGGTGQLIGESEGSYVAGSVVSTREVINGRPYSFGNIGVTLTANKDNTAATSPGLTTVYRDSYTYYGAGTSVSVARGFTFQPSKTAISKFDLVFSYLNADMNGIAESNLRLFRSDNGDIPFEKLDITALNTSAKTLTKEGITGNLAALFTLGDVVNPLPVTLVSFTAAPTSQGGALLRWITASETNNKGFAIERQLGKGQAWEQVGYLNTGNSTNGSTYTYTDKNLANAPYASLAYYRLRQEDQDGKFSYSPVAVVARQAEVASTALQLSPVPVSGSSLLLTFAEANQAGAEISITNTQGQRLFSQTTQANSDSALSLPVESLAAGVYIVSVRVPGQAIRHARFVKI
jgi:hypothetical protein